VSALDLRGLPAAVFGSGVSRRLEFGAWDAALRGGLSTTRRIGFLSLVPGVGATSLALQVTRIVASRRSEPVLAVDVSGDDRGLGARLRAQPTTPDETRAGARTTAEAMTGLAEHDGVVALRPDLSDGAVGGWLTEAAPVARFFEVAITDFGARHPLVDLPACAALCDVVCVVSDARRSPAEHARALAPAIASLPEAPTPVLAFVDHAREGDGVARLVAAGSPHPVIGVPFDARMQAGSRPRAYATRRALLQLAATLVAGRELAAA
jgi:hypothetical protein